jgi:dipeptidyl aminopeptidase/acylaminoacyl peptidase
MRKAFSIFFLVLCFVQTAWSQQELTLEEIMQHPRWIGSWPEEVTFEPGGNSIFYLAHGASDSATLRYPRGYEVVEIDRNGEVIEIHDTSGLPSSPSRLDGPGLYSFQGDLFLSDKAGIRRLTRTKQRESECRWLGPDRFVYRAGGKYFVRDLASHVERQVAELKSEEPSEPGEDYRSKQQDRMFPVLKEREDASEKRKRADGIPRFYLGDDRQLVSLEVTPNERQALLIHGSDAKQDRDSMPVYLNRDGSVTTETLRAKVGAKEPTDHQLSILDLRTETVTPISLESLPRFGPETTAYVETTEWSRTGRLALSLFSEDFEERWIVEVDFKNSKLVLIEHLHDDAWHAWDLNEFGWLPNSKSLWYQSEKTGYAHLYLWNGQTSQALTSGQYEVTQIHPAPDGRSFFFRANREDPSVYNVNQVNLEGRTSQVSKLGGQTMFDLSPDGQSLVLLHSKTATPPEIFLQASKSNSQPKRLTRLASTDFLDFQWTVPKFVDVPSTHHDRPIRSKLYSPPAGVSPNGAAVVFVHGAGYLQNSDQGWSYYFREFMFHTLLTRRGVTVLDMDYRASAGYGRDWRTAIYRQMGTPELEDLKDGVAYLVKEHGVQASRVGVYGGSYGGFMTLMALFKEPDLFACGAALRPVTDWSQYEHGYTARILNTPDEDPEAFDRSSPIEFAEGLKNPLLMCHGMLDDNVVAQDTIRLTQRLIQLKKEDWEMALYPLEPHGFVEPESWLDEYRRILKLFEKNLEI